MPLRYFKCPDNATRLISLCLNECPRAEGRCLSLPTLYSIGQAREWNDIPSTTQLLNPTRMEYLKIKKTYAINPFDMAFALLGTRHHKLLEIVAKKIEGLVAEKKLSGEVTGILDLLEPINGGEEYRLIDYKTYGSYAVAKLLSDTNGQHERQTLALQMNNYRIMAQGAGFNVKELKCQFTVRDGGTQSAYRNGIEYNLKMIEVPIMDDDDVTDYFISKAKALKDALANNELPPICDYAERWQGRRCKGYCDVSQFCPEGAKVNKVKLEDAEA